MKHILCVSSSVPRRADRFQDLLCEIIHQAALITQAKGGSLPFITYMDEKCQVTPVTPEEISPYGSI
jgi:hypothetical protein